MGRAHKNAGLSLLPAYEAYRRGANGGSASSGRREEFGRAVRPLVPHIIRSRHPEPTRWPPLCIRTIAPGLDAKSFDLNPGDRTAPRFYVDQVAPARDPR